MMAIAVGTGTRCCQVLNASRVLDFPLALFSRTLFQQGLNVFSLLSKAGLGPETDEGKFFI